MDYDKQKLEEAYKLTLATLQNLRERMQADLLGEFVQANVQAVEIEPYEINETMKIIGFQEIPHGRFQKVFDVLQARNLMTLVYTCKPVQDAILDVFICGYIEGIRAERAKKKKKAANQTTTKGKQL